MTVPVLARALAACALLGACAPAPLVMGVVDPERVDATVRETAAPNCALRQRASLPVTMAGLPMVTATINGRPARLILDTGAESSIVTVAAARRLGVTNKFDFNRSMSGIGQTLQTGDAKLESMSLGTAVLSYPRILVGPVSVTMGGVEPDGLLGASLLSDFDLDIDLPRGRLTLYDKTSCPDLLPPWGGPQPTVLTTTRSLSSHPFFKVEINGQVLGASLDTGAQRTVITASAAKRVGIGQGTRVPGSEIRARGAAGEVLPAELHILRDMRVGDVPVRSPVIVTPVSLPRDIDVLIGSDFLATHRTWLSYDSRKLFVR